MNNASPVKTAREDRTGQNIAGAAVRVTGGGQRLHRTTPEPQLLSFLKKYICARDHALGACAIDDLCAGGILDERGAGDVIGMDMRFDGREKRQPKFLDEAKVALDVFDDRIDNDRLAGITIAHKVGTAFGSVVNVLYIVHVQ
jgi:hypothetical protein